MELNNDITRRIISMLFVDVLNPVIYHHVKLQLICKSWQRYIYRHTTTYHLYNIKHISICKSLPNLTKLCIEDQHVTIKTAKNLLDGLEDIQSSVLE